MVGPDQAGRELLARRLRAEHGAARAYYTKFSLAPLLQIVVSVAGLVFGEDAARGEIQAQLQDLMGEPGAGAVQDLLSSVRAPADSLTATAMGLVLLLVGAASVFAELQSALGGFLLVALMFGLIYKIMPRQRVARRIARCFALHRRPGSPSVRCRTDRNSSVAHSGCDRPQ
jgi:uncharacterized BrkB/YihY/UPF0761 family membrane protein